MESVTPIIKESATGDVEDSNKESTEKLELNIETPAESLYFDKIVHYSILRQTLSLAEALGIRLEELTEYKTFHSELLRKLNSESSVSSRKLILSNIGLL
jgi:hypothetical protein